jgi:OOP family OmpA-OmpF porin
MPADKIVAVLRAIFLVWCLPFAPLFTAAAGAQTTATISGTIDDANKGVLPGATVTVTNTATNLVRSAAANETGRYVLAGLTPGIYDLKVAIAAAPVAPAPVIEKVTLQSDVLFEFDKAELRPAGRDELDQLAERIKDAQVESVLAVGHADRIGPEQYNEKLSAERAEAVKQYLAQKGVEQQRVQAQGLGESQPVTGDQCKGVKGSKLISCLQPDRRVEIEVRGTRETASVGSPAAGGTSGSTGGATTPPK